MKASDKPCGLSDTDSCEHGWERDFSPSVEGRKEGDNPCELSITDTDLCGYVSTDILIHTYSFPFFFF